jgi:hypothetical protein
MLRQKLTSSSAERHIDAPPELLYDLVADVTRTPELSPDIVSCRWLDGATGPTVGARFKAINRADRGPNWSNKPVVTIADPGREFAFARSEPFAGTIHWRYTFTPEGTGTRVVESYSVIRPLTVIGWFIIGVLYGRKDRRTDLQASMEATLDRLAALPDAVRQQ